MSSAPASAQADDHDDCAANVTGVGNNLREEGSAIATPPSKLRRVSRVKLPVLLTVQNVVDVSYCVDHPRFSRFPHSRIMPYISHPLSHIPL